MLRHVIGSCKRELLEIKSCIQAYSVEIDLKFHCLLLGALHRDTNIMERVGLSVCYCCACVYACALVCKCVSAGVRAGVETHERVLREGDSATFWSTEIICLLTGAAGLLLSGRFLSFGLYPIASRAELRRTGCFWHFRTEKIKMETLHFPVAPSPIGLVPARMPAQTVSIPSLNHQLMSRGVDEE